MKASLFNIQKFCLNDGPGIRTTVFFGGCNLRCRWCANPECHLRSGQREYGLEELLAEVLKDKVFYDKSGGGVTLSGGEVLTQAEFALEFCRLLHENGVRTAAETAGNVPAALFGRFLRETDFVFMDLKHHDSARHREGTGVGNEQILENLERLVRSGVEYRVRIPVIPGFNDSPEDAEAFCRVLEKLGVRHLELLPFHQFGEGKYQKHGLPYAYAGVPRLTREQLAPYFEIFRARLPDVIMK